MLLVHCGRNRPRVSPTEDEGRKTNLLPSSVFRLPSIPCAYFSQAVLVGALTVLGEVARAQGDDAASEPLYREALNLAREQGDVWRSSVLLHNLGHSGD
jgi:hypothetical protein